MISKSSPCCHRSIPKKHIRFLLVMMGCVLAYILTGIDASVFLSGSEISDNVWIVFLLGIVASLSTCLAITGGIIVAYTDLTIEHRTSRRALLTHQIFLHGGRILGFVIFGGLLGMLGEEIRYTLGFTTRLNGIVSLLLLCIALQIIGLLPSYKIPGYTSDRIHRLIHEWGRFPFVTSMFGAMTFFVPCGFTQMIQVMALASGSLLSGAIMMGMFALGTFPGLFLLGVGTSLAKVSHKKYFEWLIAVVLIAFSLYSIWGTIGLLGWRNGITNTISTTSAEYNEREYLTMGHDGLRLVPEHIFLEEGKNYEITIVPERNGVGCMSSIALPSLHKKIYPVSAGEDIVYSIENAQKGQYIFVCSSMGMEQGKIIVE